MSELDRFLAKPGVRESLDKEVTSAIGDAVLALHKRGEPLDQARLIAQLLESVCGLLESDWEHIRHKVAAEMLGWTPPTSRKGAKRDKS